MSDIRISLYSDTQVKNEHHYVNDKLHRENGPAAIQYYENGVIKQEDYYIDGRLHRENGPANTYYWEDGEKESERYYVNNRLHKIDGPAVIVYLHGKVRKVYYLINDLECTKEQIEEIKFNIQFDKDVELILKT